MGARVWDRGALRCAAARAAAAALAAVAYVLVCCQWCRDAVVDAVVSGDVRRENCTGAGIL